MNVIENNPFRILGVYANASIRDIKANEAKAKAFLNVGREVTYPCDFNQLLSSVQRTAEMIAESNSQLTLPNEKIKHALFWFVKATPLDEIAFNHLVNGNTEQTMEIWKKKECFSSLLNVSTQALAQGHVLKAVDSMMTLLESENYRCEFIKAVTDETFQISEEELVHTYLDVLIPASSYPLLQLSTLSDKYKNYVKDKLVAPTIADIEAEITKAKSINRENSSARYNAGVKLMNLAKNELAELKELLVGNDMRYQIIADKLGLEILQCGIDYYNNSEDADAAHKAMELQSCAQTVVIGQIAKDRCKQNTDILKKIIAELPPMEVLEEDRAIRKELERFCNLPDEVQYAIELLRNTLPHFRIIRKQLGRNNTYYLKLSTKIVGNALHNVIEEINTTQKEVEEYVDMLLLDSLYMDIIAKALKRARLIDTELSKRLRPVLRESWKAIKLMDKFDIENDFKNTRYLTNRESLVKMCDKMSIAADKEYAIIKISIMVLIIHTIWGIGATFNDSTFWEGVIAGIVGWFFPINYLGILLLSWIYDKISK